MNQVFVLNCLIFIFCGARTLSAQSFEIWEIQGNQLISPMAGSTITSQHNIVTAVRSEGFFMQTPDSRSDNDPATSDGIWVFTNSVPNVGVGYEVSVTGTVGEWENMTQFSDNGLSISVSSFNNPLPTAVPFHANFPSPNANNDLEKVEGMLVSFEAMVCGPSNDYEQAVLSTSSRPFREPGIRSPGLPGLPVWDGNPEVFYFDPNGLTAPNNRFLSFGMEVSASAIMTQQNSRYTALPTIYTTQGSPLVRGVRTQEEDELTLASLNALFLLETNSNYNDRITKFSKYIIESLQAPDIIAMQEVGSQSVLQDLSFRIGLNAPGTIYQPYFKTGPNDINLGFLVKNSITVTNIIQLGKEEIFTMGGVLHDRPPLLLECELPTFPPTPLSVLNLHLRSLIGIEGGSATFVRNKRNEQAISVANMIQQRQDNNLFIVGDYNAYEFSDGYVDVTNQISGGGSLGAQIPPQSIVTPNLINHTANLSAEERYSFVFQGNAQMIDHCLSTQLNNLSVNELQFARGNADNSVAYFDNPFIVNRVSDHDGFVVFIEAENPLLNTPAFLNAPLVVNFPNPFKREDIITVNSPFADQVQIEIFNAHGQLIIQKKLEPGQTNWKPYFPFADGIYFLKVSTLTARYLGKIVIH